MLDLELLASKLDERMLRIERIMAVARFIQWDKHIMDRARDIMVLIVDH